MLLNIIHAALFTPIKVESTSPPVWGAPLVLEGAPGVAKSSIIKAFARRCGFPSQVLDAQSGEGAYGCIPIPMKDAKGRLRLCYPAPDYTDKFEAAGCGLVMCDEMTSSPPLLQAAQMSLVLDKRIGNYELGPRVRVLGACNPVDVATNGYEISAPMANRCVWLPWSAPTVEEHETYMMSRATQKAERPIDALAEEERVLDAWPAAYAYAVGLEVAFLRAFPQLKNTTPKPGTKMFSSDRSMEMATLCLASSKVHNLTDSERDAFVTGCVGAAVYEQWSTFIEMRDVPDMADLLDGKVQFTHDRTRLDRSAVVFSSATTFVCAPGVERRKQRAELLWSLILAAITTERAGIDMIVPCVMALMAADLATCPAAITVMSKVQPAVSAANAATRTP
jgi:hypothetical protein